MPPSETPSKNIFCIFQETSTSHGSSSACVYALTPEKLDQMDTEADSRKRDRSAMDSSDKENTSNKKRTNYTTKKRKFQTLLAELGTGGLWRQIMYEISEKHGRKDESTVESLCFKGMLDTMRDIDSVTGRRKLWIMLTSSFTEYQQKATVKSRFNIFSIYKEIQSGTATDMFALIKRQYSSTFSKLLPTRRAVDKCRDLSKIEFMEKWKLQVLPHGFRVSLVEAVCYVAKRYGLDSLEGTKVDIWGDGVLRGRMEVTRMCFRFLGTKDRAFSGCQSRKEIFSFAVFCGKDSRLNMETNLGSFDIVGEKGWLFEETRILVVDRKVKLTLSGDAPFLNRLVTGFQLDNKLSKATIWVPATILTKQTGDDGYRTSINLAEHLAKPLPETTLIYLENKGHVIPDPAHSAPRTVEKDIKSLCEYLLTWKRIEHVKKLESNINKRHVKYPHFHISFKKGTTAFNAKSIDDISLSGEDAKVILAAKEHLTGTDEPCDLLDGVLFDNINAPHVNETSIRVVKELLTKLDGVEPNWGEKPSERFVGDLLFRAHRNFQTFCRDPAKNKTNSDELAIYVDLYYHATILLFQVDAFTPYKMKQHVMLEILKFGTIQSISNHMSEGTENSNHECKANYGSHTMRDGGKMHNTTSEFTDLFTSFLKSIDLGDKEHDDRISFLAPILETGEQEEQEEDNAINANKARDMYLSICQAELPTPRLLIGKEEPAQLSGMKFLFCGKFGSLGKVDGKSVTKDILKTLVGKMGGKVIDDAEVENLSEKYNKLPFYYCVLPNADVFQLYESVSKDDASQLFKKTTRGDWDYLNGKFILDCAKQKKLLNPEDYFIKHDSSMFVKSRAFAITRMMERQRNRNDSQGILAKTALRRHQKTVRNANFKFTLPTTIGNAKSHAIRGRGVNQPNCRINNASVATTAFCLYKKDYFRKNSESHPDSRGSRRVDYTSFNTAVAAQWKNDTSGRATFYAKARSLLTVNSPGS